MRILHVITNLKKGGAQKLLFDIANELHTKENNTIKILVLSRSKNEFEFLSKELDIVSCNTVFNFKILGKNSFDLEEYEKIVDDFRPSIIHSHLYLSELIVHENPRKGIHYVSHFHDDIVQFRRLSINILTKSQITNFFEKRWLIRKYNKSKKTFICISTDSLKYYSNSFPKKLTQNLVFLKNAIKVSAFINTKNQDLKKIKIINVGNFLVKKNQSFLIDVVVSIKNKGYNVSLDLLGDGVEKEKVFLKAKQLKVENLINFRGHVDSVNEYLSDSNIYLHSATRETFGLVIAEAMAAKVPVIQYKKTGHSDIIENQKNGMLINKLDPELFSDAVIKMFFDKNFRENLIENAYNSVLKLDISIYCNQLIKLYKK